jgi:transposase-like protein
MLRPILPSIASLQEHLHRLINQPEDYRPEHCPQCGQTHLWCHGHYTRKPRENGEHKEVDVLRYRCVDCKKTCSVLPSCIAPRRWYMWSMQQAVLMYLLCGGTQEACAQELAHLGPAIRTMQRWWRWLRRCNDDFALHLRNKQPDWGRTANWQEFWRAAMVDEPLRELMAYLDSQGVDIP